MEAGLRSGKADDPPGQYREQRLADMPPFCAGYHVPLLEIRTGRAWRWASTCSTRSGKRWAGTSPRFPRRCPPGTTSRAWFPHPGAAGPHGDATGPVALLPGQHALQYPPRPGGERPRRPRRPESEVPQLPLHDRQQGPRPRARTRADRRCHPPEARPQTRSEAGAETGAGDPDRSGPQAGEAAGADGERMPKPRTEPREELVRNDPPIRDVVVEDPLEKAFACNQRGIQLLEQGHSTGPRPSSRRRPGGAGQPLGLQQPGRGVPQPRRLPQSPLEFLAKAIALDERTPAFYHLRAGIHRLQGDPEKALADLGSGLELEGSGCRPAGGAGRGPGGEGRVGGAARPGRGAAGRSEVRAAGAVRRPVPQGRQAGIHLRKTGRPPSPCARNPCDL